MVRRTAKGWIAVVSAAGLLSCATAQTTIKREEDRRVAESPFLHDRLAVGSLAERVAAARALGRIQSPRDLDALAAALSDGDRAVRLAAAFAIGQLGLVPNQPVDPRAAQALVPLLDDPDPGVVSAALTGLGKLAIGQAPERITPFLSHADAGVRSDAAFALFRCRFAPVWRGETDEPPVLPDTAASALIEAMRDPDPGVRFAATYAFSRYGDARARDALLEAATAEQERIRLFAVRGLGHVADETTLPHLVARLKDASPGVRVEAVGALRRAGASELLKAVVDDPSFHVRAAVANALADDTSVGSRESLLRLTDDPSVTVRSAAIEARATRAAATGRERTELLGDIETWAADDDWRIRAAAARAAAVLEHEAAIAAAFGDAETRVQTAVLAGLDGSSAGDDVVAAAIARDDLAVRGTAIPLLADRDHLDRVALMSGAYDASPGDDWVEVRESLADALAGIDGAERLLRRMIREDPAPSVRGKAAAALGETLPERAAGPAYPASRWIVVDTDPGTQVDLETPHGTMRITLLSEEAPIHVAAFLERVDAGFYDGLIWHRVVSNFVIQGGDPRGDGWGSGGESLRDEINTVRYVRGTLGMPKAGKDTGGCQLFITHVPTPHLDGNYTVFGQVVDGLDVIDAIEVGDAILSLRRVGV